MDEKKKVETKKPEKKKRGIRQFLRGLFRFIGRKEEKALKETLPTKPVARPRKKEVSLAKQLRLWRKRSEELTKRVRVLERQLRKSEIAPRQALGGVRVVYATAGHEDINLDKEIRKTKSLMKLMEIDYHKMRATPEQFRTKMLEYRERMHLLQLEKDELAREGMKIRHVGGKIKEIALKSPEGGPEIVQEFEQSIKALPLEWSSDSGAELAEVASTSAMPRSAGAVPAKPGKMPRAKKGTGKFVESRARKASAVKKQAVKIKPMAKPKQMAQMARALRKPVPVRQTPVQAKAKPALKKPLPAQPKPLPQKAAQAPRKPFPVPATEQAPVPVRIVESKPAAVKPVPAKPEPAKPKLEKPAVPLTKPGLQAVSKPKTEPPVLEKQEIPNGGLSKGILSKIKSATMLKPVRKPVPLPPKPAQQKPILPKPKSPPQKPAMQAVKKFEVKAENVVVKGKDEPVTKPAQDPDSKDHSFKIMSQREKIAQWAEERRARLNQDREKQKRIAGNLDEGTEEHDAAPATPAKADTVQEPLPKQGEAQEKTGNLRSLFKGKPANKSEEERIAGLEERMTALMQKHNVSSNEVKREAMAIDAPSVVGSFNKLIGLLESKYEGTSGGMYRGGRGGGAGRESLPNTTSLGMDAMLKRQAAETATPTDLKKKRIVTDFDRTLSLVTEREKIRISEIASELNISSGRVEECCDILERGNLIEIHYPAIGKPYVQVANYAELRAAQKEQEKDAKPKKKGAGKNV